MEKAPKAERKSYTPDPHRLLPQSPDAEKSLLSSFLIAPREIGAFCTERGIRLDHFAIPSHAVIYGTLMAMWVEEVPLDFITLTQVLRDSGKLDACGGAAFVTELFTFLPTAANAAHYAAILEEKLVLREIIRKCVQIAADAYDKQDDIPALVESLQSSAISVGDLFSAPRKKRPTNAQVIRDILTDYGERNRAALFGDPIGFPSLDRKILGISRGDMVLVCGGTSSGKSAFALQWSANVARAGGRVLYFPFEMDQRQNLTRLIQGIAERNIAEAMNDDQRNLGDDTDARIGSAATEAARYDIEFCDNADEIRDFRSIGSAAIRRHLVKPLDLIVIDYDELIPGGRPKGMSEEEHLAEIANGSKRLAHKLGCRVALLSQVTADDNGKVGPRRCRAKLNASNTALYIETLPDEEDRRNVYIWKQRDGSRGGRVRMGFAPSITRFFDVPEDEEENQRANRAAHAARGKGAKKA